MRRVCIWSGCHGTLGQAGAATEVGGAYTLSGGFWGAAATYGGNNGTLYLPLLVRDKQVRRF